jgi:hypothetical protein
MLIADSFTLVGFRGYNKIEQLAEKQQLIERGQNPDVESAPVFKQSMSLEHVEQLGGCTYEEEANV